MGRIEGRGLCHPSTQAFGLAQDEENLDRKV